MTHAEYSKNRWKERHLWQQRRPHTCPTGRTQSWFVISLRAGREIELEMPHRQDVPERVFGRFVETTPNSLKNRGDFLSSDLRSWFNTHLAGRL